MHKLFVIKTEKKIDEIHGIFLRVIAKNTSTKTTESCNDMVIYTHCNFFAPPCILLILIYQFMLCLWYGVDL